MQALRAAQVHERLVQRQGFDGRGQFFHHCLDRF